MNPGSSAADTRGTADRAGGVGRAAVLMLPWIALVLLAAWTRRPSPWWLLAAAAAVVATGVSRQARDRIRTLGVLLMLVGVVTGFLAHLRLDRLSRDFEGYWAQREAQ